MSFQDDCKRVLAYYDYLVEQPVRRIYSKREAELVNLAESGLGEEELARELHARGFTNRLLGTSRGSTVTASQLDS